MDEFGAIVAGDGWEEEDLEVVVNAVEFRLRDVGSLIVGGKSLVFVCFRRL